MNSNNETTSRGNAGSNNAINMFITHVKHVLSTLPPVTKFVLYAPFIISLVDLLLWNSYTSISNYIFLDAEYSINKFQVYRLLLYPLSSRSFLQVFITAIWLFPEINKMEQKKGSLKLIYYLILLFTLLPALAYIVTIKVVSISRPDIAHLIDGYFGMAGWVVGLVFWYYLEEDSDSQQDRMIAGSVRIPNKFWPVLVLIFFVFLAPGPSFVLNLFSAGIAWLFVRGKLPRFFTPSDEAFTNYESKAWLRILTNASNYVSTNSTGGYLPIINPSPYASVPSAPSNTNSNNGASFPGTGVRLGS